MEIVTHFSKETVTSYFFQLTNKGNELLFSMSYGLLLTSYFSKVTFLILALLKKCTVINSLIKKSNDNGVTNDALLLNLGFNVRLMYLQTRVT